ncbi:hypothetical protein [Companilactobacillus alimentarius]|nr:hypothetical protein [Companilactobacillus alimentarius]MDT6951163.1 hypothetical protein [Companilactobacillus alimentarius]MDT6953621.1 hypothetical protein [Companilactobacillus alimentarius]MDT6953689.1 hypothetical protein [Companilactobacillus alimentarius]
MNKHKLKALILMLGTNSIKNTKVVDTKWIPFVSMVLGLVLAIGYV